MKWGSPNTTPGIRHQNCWKQKKKKKCYLKHWSYTSCTYSMVKDESLTWRGWLVCPAVTRGAVFEVVMTVVRPQAAVIEAENIIEPVGLGRNSGRFLEGRWAPVVCSVWCAAPDRVCCQDLCSCAVIAALLPCAILRAVKKLLIYLSFRTATLLL